jgi:hypothetical protein
LTRCRGFLSLFVFDDGSLTSMFISCWPSLWTIMYGPTKAARKNKRPFYIHDNVGHTWRLTHGRVVGKR